MQHACVVGAAPALNALQEPSISLQEASMPVSDRSSPRDAGVVVPIGQHGEFRLSVRVPQYLRGLLPFASLRSSWDARAAPLRTVVSRTWQSILADKLFGHAAELGFYFLFALFPTLFCAGSIVGLAARSAHQFTDRLLETLALVIPTAALGTVLTTFNETTAAATSGKVTFGFIGAIWSASVGISAIQDTLNAVYKINDSRSYFAARIDAVLLTALLIVLVSFGMSCIFLGDLCVALIGHDIANPFLFTSAAIVIRLVGWVLSGCFLALSFAVVYYWAPDWKQRHWRWFTPGIVFGIIGWLFASLGFRLYLHFFSNYTLTYGSLGAVIILLTWFYITGLMLLVGAEIDSIIGDTASKEASETQSSIVGRPENLQ